MKFFIIDTYYPAFLESFYQENPHFKTASYLEQKKTLFDQQFGLADFYSKNLQKLGHQAEEFVVNNEVLQKQWAKEHDISYRNYFRPNWQEKILAAQIEEFKPEVIYCQELGFFRPKFLEKIKKQAQLLVGQIASPLPEPRYLQLYDLILSSLPFYVVNLRKMGIGSEYLKLGFEADVLQKLSESPRKYQTVFIGGLTPNHQERKRLFNYLVKKTEIDFWGYGLDNLEIDFPLRYHGEAWGLKMYNILFNARISLNQHLDIAQNYAGNMRLYESTGVGTMLITDDKDNLNKLFEVGKEVEVYSSKEELLEKIKYYLTHEKERKKIAEAGQKRTLKDHSYEQRVKELVKILERYL